MLGESYAAKKVRWCRCRCACVTYSSLKHTCQSRAIFFLQHWDVYSTIRDMHKGIFILDHPAHCTAKRMVPILYTHLHIRTDRFRLAMNYILLRITIASLSLYVVSTLAYALCVRCFCQRILSYWLRTIGKYRIGNVYLNYIFFARAERCI